MKLAGLFFSFLALAVLTGCPQRPSVPAPQPRPRPTPVPPPPAITSYIGTWAVGDESGRPFDIVVFSNGQAVSTFTKDGTGTLGKRGFWRMEKDGLVVTFDDGWTDRIAPVGNAFQHRGFEPGATAPKSESPATRVSDPSAAFVGTWRLNQEPDGSHLYVVLQSSGRAFSSIAGGTEGKWTVAEKGALCSWPDGWNDLIFPAAEGYQKRSWVGQIEQNTTPPDISEATRVGETKFTITP